MALFARLAIFLTLACLPLGAQAQGILRDDFESPDPVLRPVGGEGRHRVELHQRVEIAPHSGLRCEQIRVTGAGNIAIYYSYPIEPARVISELRLATWLRADRPGMQLMARVVLPHSAHPTTGEPLTTLIRGSDYRQVGRWQLLEVANLPRAVELQVRVLRTQFGPQVDAREAYVDMLLLNVYGGEGTSNVWVDDLEITGAVPLSAVATVQSATRAAAAQMPTLSAGASRLPTATPVASMPAVELRNRLQVDGEPFFPRIIEHRGEPLVRLQQLGFNCVRLTQPPTAEQLDEAIRLRLWLIATPPPMDHLRANLAGPPGAPTQTAIGPQFDAVLAWDLGSNLTNRQYDVSRQWALAVQAADPRGRPIVCGPTDDLQNFTRPPFKIMLAERDVLGTTFPLSAYSAWLNERTQLARAATPLWAMLPSQASPELARQMELAARTPVIPPVWQEAQLRTLMHLALAARARGIGFTSHARLDSDDPATRIRAATLELLNLELRLIERWPAAGNFSSLADSSDRHTTGAVLETERSRLLLPIYRPPAGQFVLGTQSAPLISYTAAGVPEGDNAYELSLTALRPLRSARRAGGMTVALSDKSRDSLVVFTSDERVLRYLKTTVQEVQRRALHLATELAELQLTETAAIAASLAPVGQGINLTQEARKTVEQDLQRAKAQAATDIPRAYDDARHALQVLRQLQRVTWEQSTSGAPPLSDPLSAAFATLPARTALLRELPSLPRTDNRLAEGGCENLSAMLAAGWKHYQRPHPQVQTGVDLSPRAAHSGEAGLLLRAQAADSAQAPSALESPPVWITSAPVAVETGDLLQIEAWIRIDAPLTASSDGLVIFDSHSGEPLAVRMTSTQGWRQLTLIRAATRPGPFVLTFALAGLGEAAIDDVSVQLIQRGASAVQARR